MSELFRVYLETSALNSFAENSSVADAIATKEHQNKNGRGWYLSPVVLAEVLLTKDEQIRDMLIMFAQHACESTLLPSPEELMVSYINAGCPKYQEKYELASKGPIAQEWRAICDDKRKTMGFSADTSQHLTHSMKKIPKIIFNFAKTGKVDFTSISTEAETLSIEQLMKQFSLVHDDHKNDSDYLEHTKLVTLFILMFMCAGLGIDSQTIDDFWEQKGVHSMMDRITKIFTEHADLVHTGPFHQMACMMKTQTVSKYRRGVYFDCMHTIYAIYADFFISKDADFKEFRDGINRLGMDTRKLVMYDELQITRIPPA
jgi:hypothetical protein